MELPAVAEKQNQLVQSPVTFVENPIYNQSNPIWNSF